MLERQRRGALHEFEAHAHDGEVIRHVVRNDLQDFPQLGVLLDDLPLLRAEEQVRAHAGEEFRRPKGLGHIIAGAELEATHHILGVRFGREENDRDLPRGLGRAQLAAHFVAVHFRHHHIEQNEIEMRCLFADLQRLDATGRHLEIVISLQQSDQDLDVGRRIINEQQTWAAGRGGIHEEGR